jgi:hypothetical protein
LSRSSSRRRFAAETIFFIELVIFWMFLVAAMRPAISFSVANARTAPRVYGPAIEPRAAPSRRRASVAADDICTWTGEASKRR